MRKKRPAGVRKLYKRVAKRHHKKECVACGTAKALTIHHIDHNWRNNNSSNLIFLCRHCHKKLHNDNELIRRIVQLYQEMYKLKRIVYMGVNHD